MNIGVNVSALAGPYSGISRYISNLYRHILKEDTSNDYVFFSHVPITSGLVPDEILRRTKFFTFPHYVPKSIQKVFFDLYGIKAMLNDHHVDIYHSPAYTLPIGAKSKRKYVVTFHDMIAFQSPKLSGFFISVYLRIIIFLSIRLADWIIADSEHTAHDIIQRYPRHPKVEAIHLGIPDDYFQLENSQHLNSGTDWKPYILAVSTHPYRKNINGIIQAIGKSEFLKNNYNLFVVGTIPEGQKGDILRLASDYGYGEKMKLLHNVSDAQLVTLYRQATVLVYPSFYEGFGLPIIEAMACGCPVITSNCSSMPELMPDKDWLVDPHNTYEITLKIETLLSLKSDLRRSIIGQNTSWVRRFTWSNTAKKMVQVFGSL
ncbi:MAG: glycosyltransferase family 1 protein [bacterium]